MSERTKPETMRKFEFTRNGIFYDNESNPILCVAAMRKVFGIDDRRKKVRIVGSLKRGGGKGWISVKADPKRELIKVGGRCFEMHYDLEAFLTSLGVINKRFYVRLEK